MSKIICDLCGTSYPDTEDQCPICGTAKTDTAAQRNDQQAGAEDNYSYVRGGRFSASNVRKHNDGNELPRSQTPAKPKKEAKDEPAAVPPVRKREPAPKKPQPKSGEKKQTRSNLPLIIIVTVLFLAILGVGIYLISFIMNADRPNAGGSSTSSTLDPNREIPCTGISLDISEITFDSLDKTQLLSPVKEPANTTEKVLYYSSDENVVTVSEGGIVRAVGPGTATISVVCGGASTSVQFTCTAGQLPPPPSTNPTDPPDLPPVAVFELNRSDFTLKGYGASWNLANANEGYLGPDPTLVTWTSSNPEVATVNNGLVVAVGNGKATITAEYDGMVVTAIARCNSVEPPVETGYKLDKTDVTMKVGESFKLHLIDKTTGQRITEGVVYTVWHATHVSVDDEGNVTCLQKTNSHTKVFVEYEGVTYECIVRIKPAEEEVV